MKPVRNIVKIALRHIKRWRSNARFWFIIAYTLFFSYYFTQNLPTACEVMNMKISPWIFPHLTSQSLVIIYISVPLIVMFCDAPYLDDTQPYIIIRSRRRLWAAGQILYTAITALLYTLLLFVTTIAVNLPHIEFTTGWGEMTTDINTNNALLQYPKGYLFVEEFIVNNFSVAKAMILSLLLFWLGSFLIGMIILCLNMITTSRLAGSVAASFVILFRSIVDLNVALVPLSPWSWLSLDNFNINGICAEYTSVDCTQSIPVAFTVLTAAAAVLAVLTIVKSRKITVEVLPPV